jgi:hypothetical protein
VSVEPKPDNPEEYHHTSDAQKYCVTFSSTETTGTVLNNSFTTQLLAQQVALRVAVGATRIQRDTALVTKRAKLAKVPHLLMIGSVVRVAGSGGSSFVCADSAKLAPGLFPARFGSVLVDGALYTLVVRRSTFELVLGSAVGVTGSGGSAFLSADSTELFLALFPASRLVGTAGVRRSLVLR